MKTTIIKGRVYTGRGFAEAVAFKDGLVTETGSFEQLERLHGDAEVMDFGQCSVLPGFIDSHLHMYNLGVSLRSVQLHGANSIAECIERGKKYIKDYNPPKNTVISGRGWNDDYFLDERRMLTRRDLDLISTEYPIVFTRACGHALTANTRAIELAGVTKDTPQPDGGQFEIGEDGLPNGIFKENASAYIKKIIKEPDLTETKAILKAAMDNASSWGITSVQTNDLHENNYSLIWQAYESLANEGKATVRAYQQCNFTTIEGYKKFLNEGFSFGMGSDMNKIGPLKLFIDGSLGARTALMRNEYSDMPGTYGIRCLTDLQLDEFVKTAVENNMQVIVHAIGDGGIEAVLDLVRFEEQLDGCDLVLTGEGRMDGQSLGGKVPIGVSRRAKKKQVPVVAIVGITGPGIEPIYDEGITAVFSTNREALPFAAVRDRGEDDYRRALTDLMRYTKAISG